MAFLTQQEMGRPTYVLTDLYDGDGFVQVRFRPHQAAADVSFLAPALEAGRDASNLWFRLLDGASVELAGRGIQRVFANLSESGAEADLFYQSGFTLYAGEEVFRLAQRPELGDREEIPELRLQRPADWPSIQRLFVAVTPQRVRQSEGGIRIAAGMERNCQHYVLPGEKRGDLAAVLSIYTGGQACFLRLVVHPEARDVADGLVRGGLAIMDRCPAKPVFCGVRQYEGGVRAALLAAGFEHYASRALMVKHTLAWSKTPVPELGPALKATAEIVPPAYHLNGEPEFQVSEGRLTATQDV
ncbi:MAG: hypothetical protein PVH95_02145 [Anaerolineae bacterium]